MKTQPPILTIRKIKLTCSVKPRIHDEAIISFPFVPGLSTGRKIDARIISLSRPWINRKDGTQGWFVEVEGMFPANLKVQTATLKTLWSL